MDGSNAQKKIVWARGSVVSYRCPKSIISAQSLYFLEQFRAWKEAGGGSLLNVEAKSADAILMLEEAWRGENQHGKQQE